jgi:hypothetical protein
MLRIHPIHGSKDPLRSPGLQKVNEKVGGCSRNKREWRTIARLIDEDVCASSRALLRILILLYAVRSDDHHVYVPSYLFQVEISEDPEPMCGNAGRVSK